VSTPSDSDENAPLPMEEPQGSGRDVEKLDIPPPRSASGDLTERVIGGRQNIDSKAVDPSTTEAHPPSESPAPPQIAPFPARPVEAAALAAALASLASDALGGRNVEREDYRHVEPRARQMNGIDFSTFVVASRYHTVNLVMILLASAILVAAFALGIFFIDSYTNPGFTVGLTSAGTVAVSVAAARRRLQARRESQADGGSAKDGPETESPPS
jgi:hypothetical protein